MKPLITPGKRRLTIDGRIESFFHSRGGEPVPASECTHHTTITICKIETNLGHNVLNERQRMDAESIIMIPEMLETIAKLRESLGFIPATDPGVEAYHKAGEILNKFAYH